MLSKSLLTIQKPKLLILGAGPVGLVAAHVMSKTCNVKLIDFSIPKQKPEHFGNQVVSLIKPSLDLLGSIIDLDKILMQPYSKVKCKVEESEFGFPMEASIVDVISLRYELYSSLPKNVQFIQGSIDKIDNTDESISVYCNNEQHVAEMALNTLGKYNVFVNTVERFDYYEMGIVSTLKLSKSNSSAFQRFLPTGPIALLPTGSDSAAIVWTLPRNIAENVLEFAKDDRSRTDLINLAFQNPEHDISFKISNLEEQVDIADPTYFPSIAQSSPLKSFPLGFHHLSEYGRDRLLAIGDAAHSIHPLAGMGLNLGLGDVKTLYGIVKKSSRFDPEQISIEFEKKSHFRNSSMIWACDIIHDLFETRSTFFAGARNLSTRFFRSQTFWSSVLSARVNKLF